MLGWVLFRADTLPQAGEYLRTMLGLNQRPLSDDTLIFYFRDYLSVMIAGLLCATPFFAWLRGKCAGPNEQSGRAAAVEALSWIVQLALFLVSVGALLMGAHNPFIYFNF